MPFGSNSDAIAGAGARAGARLEAAITDLFLAENVRLDDRTRAALRTALRRLVGGVEGDLRRHAARLLASRGDTDAAAAMLAQEDKVLSLLADAGLMRDPELMDEMIARTRAELIADALPPWVSETERPSLLVRLLDTPDRVVAGAAQALLAADSRRDGRSALSAELQHRLVWWIAAGIGATLAATPAVDKALGEAAQRCLTAYDEGERAEAVAERLVAAIDPLPGEVAALVIEALGDGRLTLVAALLARALSMDSDTVRALLVEPDDDRLWAALRGAGLSREEIARVALSLADADPRRDIEAFADRLDEVAVLAAGEARLALAPLALPRDLRLAKRLLESRRR